MKYLIKRQKKELVDTFNIPRLIDNSDLDKKITTIATKAEVKAEQDKIERL